MKEINQNERIKNILNKTFREIYTEHINSNEFIVNEIKLLKKKKMRDEYYLFGYIIKIIIYFCKIMLILNYSIYFYYKNKY